MAKPSLSQMSCQVAGLTASPNHWWASSWATTVSLVAASVPKIDSVWVSSAYPSGSSTTTGAVGDERVRPEQVVVDVDHVPVSAIGPVGKAADVRVEGVADRQPVGARADSTKSRSAMTTCTR